MFCFQKVSCSFYLISAFLLLPQFHFPWMKLTLSFYETKILEKLVYDLLKEGVWRKIFPRLKNKAFCKRLKRWVEFLLFAQIYAVLNQNNWWAVNHWRQLHVLILYLKLTKRVSKTDMPAWSLWDKRLEIPTQILHKYLHQGTIE